MLDVILLEDEPVLRHELGEFLEGLGYAPQCVASLQEFDRHFDARRHRLAIIDIGLPDGSGLALIQRLRQQGQQLGIIVFSAHNTSANRIDGLENGADHYLGKGCDLDELEATLAALVRRLGLQQRQARWLLQLGPSRLLPPSGPPGGPAPATPVVATATSAPKSCATPSAISWATWASTGPTLAKRAASTPKT